MSAERGAIAAGPVERRERLVPIEPVGLAGQTHFEQVACRIRAAFRDQRQRLIAHNVQIARRERGGLREQRGRRIAQFVAGLRQSERQRWIARIAGGGTVNSAAAAVRFCASRNAKPRWRAALA